MFKKLTITMLLTTTLVMVGCEWDYPLSSPQQGKRDEALVGFWRLKTANDNCILAFTQAEKRFVLILQFELRCPKYWLVDLAQN